MTAQAIQLGHRAIVRGTTGHTHGPITRLMSPSDFGELVKPFVFLDLASFDEGDRTPMAFGWHPHSGIATITVMLEGAVRVEETTGRNEVLPEGSIEWMRAGNGVWHTGEAEPGKVKAFQLWIALPPELENGPSQSRYVRPEEVPTDGRVRVILGTYEGMTSPIDAPEGMTYVLVNLADGERWTYMPPRGQDVAWMAVADGTAVAGSKIRHGEMVVFEDGSMPIDITARGATRFVIGSARKHPHDLVLGYYSVHTTGAALQRGETEIARIGRELRAAGTI